ncbi:MAG: hypothetical protein V2A71_00305 [Candidatus Eisenbacteria bacterium]
MKKGLLVGMTTLLFWIALPSPCCCGPIFEERGTLTVGGFAQYGMLAGDATAVDEYDKGVGYGMRLRYNLGRDRALGISLENQTFEAVPAPPGDDQPRKLKIALITMDYIFYFERRSTLTRYLTFGAGVHHPGREYHLNSIIGPDGLVLTAGGGFEYFFHKLTSLDVSVRAYGLFGQDGLMGTAQAAAGINFYIID